MKFFQMFRKYLAYVGVESHQPFEKNHSMIMFVKRLLVLIPSALWFICMIIFIGYEAKMIVEYADAFFMSVSLITINFQFLTIYWKIDDLYNLIEDFENLIEQRKII